MSSQRLTVRGWWFLFLMAAPASTFGAQPVGPAAGEPCSMISLFAEGHVEAHVCAESLDAALTVIDISDEWLPQVFAEAPPEGLAYRQTFLSLANGRIDSNLSKRARQDRFYELFGIFPTFSVIRERLGDEQRHGCHAAVDNGPLAQVTTTISLWTSQKGLVGKTEGLAVIAAKQHLRCEGLRGEVDMGPTFDAAMQEQLRAYQRRQMLPSPGTLDAETRDALGTDSRELDFHTLLRSLRERVAAATGLIEDGSAINGWEPILGRVVDSAEFRHVMRREPLPRGAPDLIGGATAVAARALGWTTAEAALRCLRSLPLERVAIRLPPRPAYHSSMLGLRAEIDRGDVGTSYPFDPDGRPRASVGRNRPTFTLFAETSDGEIPLVRWPTTIGSWKAETVDGEVEALRYKPSPVGRRYWKDLVVAPAWFPPPTTPTRELIHRRTDGSWAADIDAVGPGYRSAYGLVALLHYRALEGDARDVEYLDTAIRTHGSGNYRSILRGTSHGCHRLFNHLALRLASFLLAHSSFERRGPMIERYQRILRWKGHAFYLRAESRGYRYELTPPIPVDVLPGRVFKPKLVPSAPPSAAPTPPAISHGNAGEPRT